MLAVHGAARQGIGLDGNDDPNQGFILSHTYAQMSQCTNMVCEQVFQRFPTLKVAFLEAGCGWLPYLMERIDRKTAGLATQQVRDCPVYFHAELEEQASLVCAVSAVGEDRFIYASEYRENKSLFTCPTRQHLLTPRLCPLGRASQPPPHVSAGCS